MRKYEVEKIIEEIRSSRDILNMLEIKSKDYINEEKNHELEESVLFELELLYDKVFKILHNFYLGDVQKDYSHGRITEEEYEKLINSCTGMIELENCPSFNFGYKARGFIDNVEDIKKI